MREIVTPMLARERAKTTPQQVQKQVEDARAAQEAYRLKVMADLEEAFRDLSERDRQVIRRNVAVTLPDKPMTLEEIQLWLDERCIGVANYMKTGKVSC